MYDGDDEPQPEGKRLAWALTGSGHDFVECLELMRPDRRDGRVPVQGRGRGDLPLHQGPGPFPDAIRLIKDTSASAAPVGRFYHGWYHTLVMAPATSNTVAKCVAGISDNLVTNVFAQAGKCRVPSIVYACDTKPVHDTMAPGGMVRLVAAPGRPGEHRAAQGVRGDDGGRGHGGAGAGGGQASCRGARRHLIMACMPESRPTSGRSRPLTGDSERNGV